MEHWIFELFGVLFSLLFVFFNAREKIICWPFGILSALIYILIFFNSKLYGDSILQFYYLLVGIYGWYAWSRRIERNPEISVKKGNKKHVFFWLTSGIFLTPVLGWYLDSFTNSDVPYMDGATTIFGFIATWLMTRKYLENWLIWIFVDLFAAGLYVYKELYLTSLLYILFTGMAVYGYVEWKRKLVSA